MNNKGFQVDIRQFTALYDSSYDTETVTQNTRVKSACTSISFLNTGETAVRVLGIPLPVGAPMFSLLGDATAIINTDFAVIFEAEQGKKNELIVIRNVLTRTL